MTSTTRLALSLLLVIGACGGGSSSSSDASIDAPLGADGAGGVPDGSSDDLDGVFRLTTPATANTYARWTFDHARGTSAQAWWYPDYATANAQSSGYVGPYTFAGTVLDAPGGTADATWDPAAGTLTLVDGGETSVWTRSTPTRAESISVSGRILFATGAPAALVSPRVAMVALVFDEAGAMTIAQARTEEASTDQELLLTPSQTEATFTMQRAAAPLARELTSYGASTVAFEAFVVYQDRDGVPGLGAFDDSCAAIDVDCVHAIAPMYLAYRDGTATELETSSYGDLTPGWNLATLASVEDAGIALASLDPGGGVEGGPAVLLEVLLAPSATVRFEP